MRRINGDQKNKIIYIKMGVQEWGDTPQKMQMEKTEMETG